MSTARIGIVGLGTMGRAHLGALLRTEGARAVAVADPAPEAAAFAKSHGVAHYADFRAMLDVEEFDGVLIAAPNAEHHVVALECIARGIAVLIEKPVADTNENAWKVCEAAAGKDVPILVGHHRRHNPAVKVVRAAVADGLIGRPTVANVLDVKLKPDSYFIPAWRSEAKAGGPVLLNMIHEIDLMRFIFGEIQSLQAFNSTVARGLPVEDTSGVIVRFVNGAIGTILASDIAVTPFSWDLASGELDLMTGMTGRMERQAVPSHIFGGTKGSVTLPDAQYYSYSGEGEPGWRSNLSQRALGATRIDTYQAQMAHFAKVALRDEAPLCSGIDGMETLRATIAVKESAASGDSVVLARSSTSREVAA